MFGKNPILKQDHGDGSTLHIVKGSPFTTLQGEGPFAGRKSNFLRLHGCCLACTWCDTNFSDPSDPVIPVNGIAELLTMMRSPKLVVITGGEPLRQDIRPLCRLLLAAGKVIQIETAGPYWLEGLEHLSTIICSPKTPKIHPEIKNHAAAFKYVISTEMEFDDDGFVPITATQPGARPQKLAEPRLGAPIYLSPMDSYDPVKNRANKQLVAQLAMKYDVIAGIQLHKELQIEEPV